VAKVLPHANPTLNALLLNLIGNQRKSKTIIVILINQEESQFTTLSCSSGDIHLALYRTKSRLPARKINSRKYTESVLYFVYDIIQEH
jgi:hypothetical protein